ncbi:hypothetical protein ABT354_13330 [Streptomyces sp. NPDC000594]|uniref:hypothetical protein n=1 Tax=Streptomyces sp. NPDC000594 TaxID=3154261 RepID=UPI003319657B
MGEGTAYAVLGQLRAVDWGDDAAAFAHANSRALLMREFLRRTALWARAQGAEEAWPFFDVCDRIALDLSLSDRLAAEAESTLADLAPQSLRLACRAALRWAVLRDTGAPVPGGLPDPYEPLLLLVGRGGGWFLQEFLDLTGVMIRLGTVESNAAATPFTTLDRATLDALDAEGEITYYAKTDADKPRSSPRGIVRRRVDDEDRTWDEAFTRNLRWEPTEYLRRHELGHNDTEPERIGEVEAAAFIESVTRRLTAEAAG